MEHQSSRTHGVHPKLPFPWIVLVFVGVCFWSFLLPLVEAKHDVSKMLDYLISDEPDEYDSIRYDKTLRPNFGGDSVPVSSISLIITSIIT